MGVFKELVGHVIDLEFVTHEAMIEAALQWQIEEYQLDSGSFRGSINAVHTSHIQIASNSRSNGVFVKGYIPKNTYLFAFVESKGHITHNGISILENELIVLNENDQLDFIASSAEDDVTIVIDKDFFDNAFKEYFNELFEYDRINKRVWLQENCAETFRTFVNEMVSDLMIQSEKLRNESLFHRKTEEQILQTIFKSLDLSTQCRNIVDSEIHAEEIRKYIEKNYKSDISINELCDSKKLSDRTLRSSFKNLFGLSPKQYHISYRLGKVHHAFLQCDHNKESVENIAYEHGFTHMGHFCNSYKNKFGNTPSYTLKQIFS